MFEALREHLLANGKGESTWFELAEQFQIHPRLSHKQRGDAVRRYYNRHVKPAIISEDLQNEFSSIGEDYQAFVEWKTSQKKTVVLPPYMNGDPDNVLVIGDLHEPFCLDGYLEFCRAQQEKFDCGTVIFIGDIIDNHFASYHETDPDGLSAGDELRLAITKLQRWYRTFPEAIVTAGNHDRIIARKLYSGQLSQRWVRPINEVLQVPTWNFVDQYVHGNVLYIHGESGTALSKAKDEMVSVVQGHIHTEGYVQIISGLGGNRFAMQVGCGINFETYAFAYAQRGKKPVISCGVVLNGKHPVLIPYDL